MDKTELVEEHAEHGERVLPWAIAVAVAAGAVTMVSTLARRRRPTLRSRRLTSLVAVSVVAGAGASWTVVDVGHSGARATNHVGDDAGSDE